MSKSIITTRYGRNVKKPEVLTYIQNNTLEKKRGIKRKLNEDNNVETKKAETKKVKTKIVETKKAETKKVKTEKVNENKVRTKKVKTKSKSIIRYKRKTFPQFLRNAICSKQGWRCRCCDKLFGKLIIVDHILPLCFGGSNDIHNLQGLCATCDKFKTGYLDYKVIKNLAGDSSITSEQILQLQHEYFNKFMTPKSNNIISNNIVNNNKILNRDSIINTGNNSNKTISITINGIDIKINV